MADIGHIGMADIGHIGMANIGTHVWLILENMYGWYWTHRYG